MAIQKIEALTEAPASVTGDDLPYLKGAKDREYMSCFYRDVPDEYRLGVLIVPGETYPKTAAIIADLIAAAERKYNLYEILGRTFEDFGDLVQDTYAEYAENIERYIEALPSVRAVMGTTVTTTVGKGTPVEVTVTDNSQMQTDSGPVGIGQAEADFTPSERQTVKGNAGTVKTETQGVTESVSVSPGSSYDEIERIASMRSAQKYFCDVFQGCFTLYRNIRW